jgi:hypothetical protein
MLGVCCFGALQTLRCKFKRPREDQRDWKPERNHCYEYFHSPGWRFKRREKNGRQLEEEPAHDSIDDGNFVNVPSLQLGQKFRWIHFTRLYEALVTAALYLDALDLKSARLSEERP